MTFSNSLVLGGNQTWLNNSGSLLTAGSMDTGSYLLTVAGSSGFALSNISDSGGVTMLGSGLLQLSGSNTYAGATITNGGTLQLTGGQLVGSALQYVGSSNTASFVQSAGTVAASSGLYLGYTGSGNGSYTLNTGSLGAPNQYVGYSGTGSFAQSGGLNTSSGSLVLGYAASGNGSYNLSAGTLTSVAQYTGYSGVASFTQSGGFNTASGTLAVGYSAGSNGSYALSGGSLFAPIQVVGSSGTGSFNLSGGTSNASTALYLGYAATGIGSLNISGGSLYAGGNSDVGTYVGYSGNGSIAVSGGTTTAANVYLGYNAGGTGGLNISGGSVYGTNEYVGYSGSGSYSLSGGSNTAATALYLGELAGSSGSANISQNGYLATATLAVGFKGTGILTQSGGTAAATSLYVGDSTGGNGNYNLSGGSLYAATQYVGYTGTGSLTNSGGAVTGNLYVGYTASTGSGTYNLNGGGSYSSPTFQYVGYSGTGTFNMSDNASDTVGSNFEVGVSSGGSGTVNFSSGVMTVTTSQEVGVSSTGSFNLSGNASETVAGNIGIGVSSGGRGSFNMSGNAMAAVYTNFELGVNSGGSGAVNFSGGTLTVSGNQVVGVSGTGSFNMSGNASDAVYGNLYVPGGSGTGACNVSGGTLTVQGDEIIGDGGRGTIYVSGTASHYSPTLLVLGYTSTGNLNVSGSGSVNTPYLYSGYAQGGGSSNLNVSGGTVTVTSQLFVNLDSTKGCNIIQSGGVIALATQAGASAPASLVMGYGNGAIPPVLTPTSYTMTGGLLTGQDNTIGYNNGTAGTTFNQSGGTFAFPNDVSNGFNGITAVGAFGAATYNLSGAGVVTGNELNIGEDWDSSVYAGTGTFNQSGGMLDTTANSTVNGFAGYGTFIQSGGTNTTSEFINGYAPLAWAATNSPAGVGHFTLNGGSVSVLGGFEVGYGGIGTFNQSGGTVSTEFFEVGAGYSGWVLANGSTITATAASGTATITGGQIIGTAAMNVGIDGSGTVTQSGGLIDFSASPFGVSLGLDPTGFGAYTLSSSGVLNTSALELGVSGAGVFTQTGGTVSTGFLELGTQSTTATGTANISGGQMIGSTEMNVGLTGTGIVNQSGGTVSFLTNGVVLGFDPGAIGFYNLSGTGSLLTASNENVGLGGSGTFNQSGGTNLLTGALYLGAGTATAGAYILSGNGLLSGPDVEVGYIGSGSFSQSGGMVVTGSGGLVELGNGTGSVGAYNLIAGQVSGYELNVGLSGSGSFTQSGGSASFSPNEVLGFSLGGSGTYTQSGGTNSTGNLYIGNAAGAVGAYSLSGSGLLSASDVEVGYVGSGSFSQSGGMVLTGSGGLVEVGNAPGSIGTYNLTAGQVSGGEMNVGLSGTGSFTQSGGSVSFSAYEVVGFATSGVGTYTQSGGTNTVGAIIIGNSAGSSGTYNMNGGLLTIAGDALFNGIVGGAGSSQFSFSGGTIMAAGSWVAGVNSFTLPGGIGTIETNGHTVVLFGPISGPGGLLLSDTTGTGCLVMATSNTYSGGTTVSSGSLQVESTSALGAGALAANGGTVDLMGIGVTVHSFSGVAGTITNSGTNLALFTDTQSGRTTFGGAIQDGAAKTALVLSGGTGTLVLTGTNTFTGGTTVASGTLVVFNPYGLATGSNLSVGSEVGLFSPISPAGSGHAETTLVRPGDIGTLVLAGTNGLTSEKTALGGDLAVVSPADSVTTGSRLDFNPDLDQFSSLGLVGLGASISSADGLPPVTAVPEPGTLAIFAAAASMSAMCLARGAVKAAKVARQCHALDRCWFASCVHPLGVSIGAKAGATCTPIANASRICAVSTGRSSYRRSASATRPITRAPSGLGSSAPSSTPGSASIPTTAPCAAVSPRLRASFGRGLPRHDQRSLRRRRAAHAARLHRASLERRRGAVGAGKDMT